MENETKSTIVYLPNIDFDSKEASSKSHYANEQLITSNQNAHEKSINNSADIRLSEAVTIGADEHQVETRKIKFNNMSEILSYFKTVLTDDTVKNTVLKSESDDAEDGSEIISDKLLDLLRPFSNILEGQDPGNDEEFLLIKAEIEKHAFNDFSAILTLADEILCFKGKDLRVAGYYLLASTYLHGLAGLINGLQLYRFLLTRFGESIYPKERSARIDAVRWINNNKLLLFVRQHQKNTSIEKLKKVEQELELLNKEIKKCFNDEEFCLNILNPWLLEQMLLLNFDEKDGGANRELMHVVSAIDMEIGPISQTQYTPSQLSRNNNEQLHIEFMSQTERYFIMRQIIIELLEDKNFKSAVSFARATRWGDLNMPSNLGGITAFTPPTQNGVNKAWKNLQEGKYEQAFLVCENLFLEMDGHMLLDLQCCASKAAKAMGNRDLSILINSETSALLLRFPGLQTLRFRDDTPFANAITLDWINKITFENSVLPLINHSKDEFNILIAINSACELVDKEGLAVALDKLSQIRIGNEKQRFQLQLAMAQLCLDHDRADLALPLLNELNEQAESTYLAMWDKQLALTVAKNLQNALQEIMLKANGKDKASYLQQSKTLSARICRWDLAQAARMI